jgi:hypothetical protein
MEKTIVSKSKVFHESKTGLRTFCLFESLTSQCEDHDTTLTKLLTYYSKDTYLDENILKITIPKVVRPWDDVIKRQLNDMFKHRDEVTYKAYIIELESKDSINRCRRLDLQFVGAYDLDDDMEILFKPTSVVFNDGVLSLCYWYIRLYNKYVGD